MENTYIGVSDFIEMGSDNRPFDEVAAINLYNNTAQDLVYESFLFHVDFKECDIQTDIEDNLLLMELQDTYQQSLIGVLGVQRETIKYSVYTGNNSYIDIVTTVTPNVIYLGKSTNINVSMNFIQNNIGARIVYDTKFFDDQMGIKLSIYDHTGTQLESESLMGVNFIIDGKVYYPRIDGSVRIKVAEKVSNVLTKLTIDTTNNKTLATGVYTIRIEAFGSPDGVCYGMELPNYTEIPLTIINGAYGLKIATDENSKIIDKTTGKTLNDNNDLDATIEYSSGLENPKIAVVLERRDYLTQYSTQYNLVDLQDYVLEILTSTGNENEYTVTNTPIATNLFSATMKENLKTGTYRLVFRLYDNTNYIGESYEYIVIK